MPQPNMSPIRDGVTYSQALSPNPNTNTNTTIHPSTTNNVPMTTNNKRSGHPSRALDDNAVSSPMKSFLRTGHSPYSPPKNNVYDNVISENVGGIVDSNTLININPPPTTTNHFGIESQDTFNPTPFPAGDSGYHYDGASDSSSDSEDEAAVVCVDATMDMTMDMGASPASTDSNAQLSVPHTAALQNDTELQDLTTQMQTLPFMPSPLRNQVSNTRHISTVGGYDKKVMKNNTEHVQWKNYNNLCIVVGVRREEIDMLLKLTHDDHGKLINVEWNPNGEELFQSTSFRATFLTQHFRRIVPSQFVIRNNKSKIYEEDITKLNSIQEKKKKRGGSKRKHPYTIYMSGTCWGQKDGCQSTFTSGLPLEQLRLLTSEYQGTVQWTIHLNGACCHPVGASYGSCSGPDWLKEVTSKADGDKTSPSTRATANLNSVEDERYLCKNFDGKAVTRKQQYNIAQNAKKVVADQYGLSGGSLENAIHATVKIQKEDIQRRAKVNNKSDDYLGILQDSSFNNGGCTLHMFTKDQIFVMASLLKSGQAIFYYDPTAQMVKLNDCGIDSRKYFMHSKLSFAPEEMFVAKEDRKFSAKQFLTFVLAEHVSHHQKQDAHAKFSNDYETLGYILIRRKHKSAAKKKLCADTASADALENERLNNTDEAWGTPENYRGKKGEKELKDALYELFGKHNVTTKKPMHKMLTEWHTHDVAAAGQLAGFGYNVFNDWMLHKRVNKIEPINKAAVIAFVGYHENSCTICKK